MRGAALSKLVDGGLSQPADAAPVLARPHHQASGEPLRIQILRLEQNLGENRSLCEIVIPGTVALFNAHLGYSCGEVTPDRMCGLTLNGEAKCVARRQSQNHSPELIQ
ncbi:MAG TPA: hypothetical protein VFD47_06940 [Actinomycetota bacterium]|nr:hypothetical protein [Actinomycetota bacterium]